MPFNQMLIFLVLICSILYSLSTMSLTSFLLIGLIRRRRKNIFLEKELRSEHIVDRVHLHPCRDVLLLPLLPAHLQPRQQHRGLHPQSVGSQTSKQDQRHHHGRPNYHLAHGDLVTISLTI